MLWWKLLGAATSAPFRDVFFKVGFNWLPRPSSFLSSLLRLNLMSATFTSSMALLIRAALGNNTSEYLREETMTHINGPIVCYTLEWLKCITDIYTLKRPARKPEYIDQQNWSICTNLSRNKSKNVCLPLSIYLLQYCRHFYTVMPIILL